MKKVELIINGRILPIEKRTSLGLADAINQVFMSRPLNMRSVSDIAPMLARGVMFTVGKGTPIEKDCLLACRGSKASRMRLMRFLANADL